jgi:hypothetical protein
MEDKEYELLNKMALKISEATTYNVIKLITILIWFVEFGLAFFGYLSFDIFYWVILLLFIVANFHLNYKYNQAMEEYQELRDEYDTRFKDDDI